MKSTAGGFPMKVCAFDLNRDGKCDLITTSGVYLQGARPDSWIFVDIGRSGTGNVPVRCEPVARLFRLSSRWCPGTARTGLPGSRYQTRAAARAARGPWPAQAIDGNPGGDRSNRDMTCMAFALGDVNGDGRPDVIAASQGEGPDAMNDPRQLGDGLVWYEAPADATTGRWIKRVIDPDVAWVHASSIQMADFDGDGRPDICYAEQDQSNRARMASPDRGSASIITSRETLGPGIMLCSVNSPKKAPVVSTQRSESSAKIRCPAL